MLPMKMKNMQNVSGSPQSTLRNTRRSQNRNAMNTMTHITHNGMKSFTANRQTTNSAVYTIVRHPP